MSGRFARPYRMSPIEVKLEGDTARVGGFYVRGEGDKTRPFGSFLITLRRAPGGEWRIATEADDFPGPGLRDPILADQLIADLDAAGIRKGVVLSVAYWYGSPLGPPVADEYAKVKAENDWGAAQVASHADRLVFFCSVNPLKDYAVAEVERCARELHAKGLKLHFGNSVVDTTNPKHAAKARAVFAAANRLGLAIQPHLWTGEVPYGRANAEAFLKDILPVAPDVPVIIAHFAGGGPGYTDEALEVYAEAVQKNDPRTRNLYFDVATVADQQTPATLQKFAERIRQIGPRRVLFGHDAGPPGPRESWLIFRTTVPLTDAEFATIASNRMPYLN
jgi:predicted TIM-barrel fold metal-dependent hydrolase